MTTPIQSTYRTATEYAYNSWPVKYYRIDGRRQKKPFDLQLYYDAMRGYTWCSNWYGIVTPSDLNAQLIPQKKWTQWRYDACITQAYERLKGKIYSQASLGVDFVEYRQSLNMIEHSVGTLAKFTRQVRKLNFLGAARTLRMKYMPKGVSARRSWSNNWLEYHFGWEPLIRDIYDSIEVLNNPLKNFTVQKGRSFDYWHIVENSGTLPYRKDTFDCYLKVQQGAQVEAITNRGLHSLDQFGLANPAVLLWEIIPFSFVVDWFANVGNVLASFSDFAGMTLTRTYKTLVYNCVVNGTGTGDHLYHYPPAPPDNGWHAHGTWMRRETGLGFPTFGVKPLRLPSSVRAVTAVALLNQIIH
jgi:hypothetical protein